MERGGAGAREPEHEHRTVNRHRLDARIATQRFLGDETVAQQRAELRDDEHATEGREMRLAVVSLGKRVEGSEIGGVAELVEADGLARLLVEDLARLAKAFRTSPEGFEHAVQPVEEPHGEPLGAHGCWLLTAITSPVM